MLHVDLVLPTLVYGAVVPPKQPYILKATSFACPETSGETALQTPVQTMSLRLHLPDSGHPDKYERTRPGRRVRISDPTYARIYG